MNIELRSSMLPEDIVKRSILLAEFSQEHPATNVKRVTDYIESMGLETSPFVFVNEENVSDVREILYGNSQEDWPGDSVGAKYLGWLEMSIIIDNMDKLGEQSARLKNFGLEIPLVHELTHASDIYSKQHFSRNGKSGTSRFGFYLPGNEFKTGIPWGILLEEGFAVMTEGSYIREAVPKVEQDSFLLEMERPDLEITDMIPLTQEIEGLVFVSPVPISILDYNKTDRKFIPTPHTNAGAVVDILCKALPDLRQAMVYARTNPDGIKKVGMLINSIEPGLYSYLQTSRHTTEDFGRRLLYLVGVLGGYEAVLPESKYTKRVWEPLLEKATGVQFPGSY